MDDLHGFLLTMWSEYEPETEFIDNWHVQVIAEHLEAVYRKDIRNLVINIPPRTIKSVLVNVMFPCWVWSKDPSKKFITASHSDGLSKGFNMKKRSLIKSDIYQELFKIQLQEDADTQRYFANTENGFMKSTSVDGSITGEGADFIMVDDALNAADAQSEAKREGANNWYSTTLHNRLQDKKTGCRIVVMQRLHEKDLTGYIKEKYPTFEHLVIPMIKEKKQVATSVKWKDPRKEGEFLHPERYADNEKEEEFKGLGSYGWAGQMQQRPAPEEGGMIKKQWLQFINIDNVRNDSSLDNLTISIDATFKGSKNSDYVVLQLWFRQGADYYLYAQRRGKWDFVQTVSKIRSFRAYAIEKFEKSVTILIEDKANGPAIISSLKKEFSQIIPYTPKDSKIARLHAVLPLYEARNVFINKDLEDREEFENEHMQFPLAAHDDMVDCATQALLRYKDALKEINYVAW